VYRGAEAGGFLLSSLVTSCPPRHIGVADIDGDGLDDVSMIDAQPGRMPGRRASVESVVKVAFGQPAAAPAAPRLTAVFDADLASHPSMGPGIDQALAPGRFLRGAASRQLAAVVSIPTEGQGSALTSAFLEVAANRLMVAPFYFPVSDGEAVGADSMHILQMARGHFTSEGGLAVVTTGGAGGAEPGERLWLLRTSASALPATPAWESIPCGGCMLAAINTDGDDRDELVAFGNGTISVYRAVSEEGGFGEPQVVRTEFDLRDPDGGLLGRMPRPAVVDVDGDGRVDVLAMTTSGELIAAWGTGNGGFEPAKLLDRPRCDERLGIDCASFNASTHPGFAVLELDGSAGPEVVVVGPGHLSFHDIGADRVLREHSPGPRWSSGTVLPSFSDHTSVVAGDFDGDGVDDLAIARSSSFFTWLRGVPEIE
jgi:hypothetical protein